MFKRVYSGQISLPYLLTDKTRTSSSKNDLVTDIYMAVYFKSRLISGHYKRSGSYLLVDLDDRY